MSAKNTDSQGRLRSKTIAFRMSPEEAELLQRMADASGMTKQDYLIERALCREVTVIPNKRMQRYMEEGLLFVYKELRRIEGGGDIPEELVDLACMLGGVFAGLGREIDEEPRRSEADMIMGMVRLMQDAFFANLINRQRELRFHGFDSESTEEELVDYALGPDDKLAVLCESFVVRLVQDVRGRWAVIVNDAKGEKW